MQLTEGEVFFLQNRNT